MQSHLAVYSHSTVSILLFSLIGRRRRHFEVLRLLDGSFSELSRPVLRLLQARDCLSVLGSSDAEQAGLLDDFSREVRPIVVPSQRFVTQEVKRTLSDHEAFVSRLDHDFAAQDEVESVRLDTSLIEDRIVILMTIRLN